MDAQLAQLQVAGGRTITLTSQQGTLPIDILSSAPYPVRATLTLTSDKLLFPNGTTGWTQRPRCCRATATPTSSTSR